jgi:hypothetical protein
VSTERSDELGWFRSLVAAIGAAFIYFLIRVFGRTVREDDVPWLRGPFGGDYIGDTPYEEQAKREALTLERNAPEGGLVPRFDALAGDAFDIARVHPRVRDFYERTARYRMDVWADTWFPANVALWLLVTTISRKVNQLNFPLRMLDTAKGMESEIALLSDAQGNVRYSGWSRKLTETGRVIYTGFYMTERVPFSGTPCVKVVFPMPQGNATVILRPEIGADGSFVLTSDGRAFGDVGFYRLQSCGEGRMRAWRIATLKEHFRVYVDPADVLRCDHKIRFLGFPVLHLHYRIDEKTARGDTLR